MVDWWSCPADSTRTDGWAVRSLSSWQIACCTPLITHKSFPRYSVQLFIILNLIYDFTLFIVFSYTIFHKWKKLFYFDEIHMFKLLNFLLLMSYLKYHRSNKLFKNNILKFITFQPTHFIINFNIFKYGRIVIV